MPGAMRSLVWTCALGAVSCASFDREQHVSVECRDLGAYQCTVTHVRGASSVEVCWDLVSACHEKKPTASACVSVPPQGRETREVEREDFKNHDECASFGALSIENVRVEPR
jgi:hypothetical protein